MKILFINIFKNIQKYHQYNEPHGKNHTITHYGNHDKKFINALDICAKNRELLWQPLNVNKLFYSNIIKMHKSNSFT